MGGFAIQCFENQLSFKVHLHKTYRQWQEPSIPSHPSPCEVGNPLGDRTPSPPCETCTVCNCESELLPPVCKEGVHLVLFDILTQPRLVDGSYTVENVAGGIRKYPNIS